MLYLDQSQPRDQLFMDELNAPATIMDARELLLDLNRQVQESLRTWQDESHGETYQEGDYNNQGQTDAINAQFVDTDDDAAYEDIVVNNATVARERRRVTCVRALSLQRSQPKNMGVGTTANEVAEDPVHNVLASQSNVDTIGHEINKLLNSFMQEVKLDEEKAGELSKPITNTKFIMPLPLVRPLNLRRGCSAPNPALLTLKASQATQHQADDLLETISWTGADIGYTGQSYPDVCIASFPPNEDPELYMTRHDRLSLWIKATRATILP